MKKLLSFVLSLCMLLACALTFVACDQKDGDGDEKPDNGGSISYKQYQAGRMSYKVPSDWNEVMNMEQDGVVTVSYMKASAEDSGMLTLTGGLAIVEEGAESAVTEFKRGILMMLVDKQIEESDEYVTDAERREMVENMLPTFVLTNEVLLEYCLWMQRNEPMTSVTFTGAEILEINDNRLMYVLNAIGEFSEEAMLEYVCIGTSDIQTFTDDEGNKHYYCWAFNAALSRSGKRDDAIFKTIVNAISFSGVQASDFE